MAFECRIEADSLSPEGVRLTTVVATYPRIVHAEMLTHRAFSRNSASSRAIPVRRMIAAVETDPYTPSEWGRDQKGMQAGMSLTGPQIVQANLTWDLALRCAINRARELADLGVHKQWVNRLLEPFSWITVVISATDWNNFFALRCHPAAHPDIRRIAEMIRDALAASTPRPVAYGGWHLPFVRDEDRELHVDLCSLSAGRCARVSYLTHDGKHDPAADLELSARLALSRPMHASPFEHQATPIPPDARWPRANFRGWMQYRHTFDHNTVGG